MKKTKYYFARNYDQFLRKLKVPEGFTMSSEIKAPEWGSSGRGRPPKWMYVTLKSADVEIVMDCRMDKPFKYSRGIPRKMKALRVVEVNGHTNYTIDGVEYTYDRLGVGDSFYSDVEVDINDTIVEQFARIEKSKKFHETALTVPVIGYSISPELFEEYKQKLAAGKSIGFSPSGFGTGYTFSKNRRNHPYCKPADREIEEFFGVSPLYVTEHECD